MHLIRILFTGAVALAVATPFAAVAKMDPSMTYPIAAQNGSGETGKVTLTPVGDKTMVVIALTGAPADPQPAHIHPGTCATLNPAPKYPLSNVVDGKSTTTVDVPMASITTGAFAVNIHKSTTDIKDYVACGTLVASGMMGHPMPMSSGAMMKPAPSPSAM